MEHWICMNPSFVYEIYNSRHLQPVNNGCNLSSRPPFPHQFNLLCLQFTVIRLCFRRSRQRRCLLLLRGIIPRLDPRSAVLLKVRAGDRHRADLRALRDLEHDIGHESLNDRPERSGAGFAISTCVFCQFCRIINYYDANPVTPQ